MSVLSRLQMVGVELCSDTAQFRYTVLGPQSGSFAAPAAKTQTDYSVSCLMLTRGDIELMKYSLASFQRQTYANRELVVVAEPTAGEKVRAFIASQELVDVNVFIAPPGLTLGDHRNLAAARARGAILVTWDDDDLSDPRRLDVAVHVLKQTGAPAACLSRLLIWWPQRRIAAISGRKLWEGTMAIWRSYLPVYPSLQRGEDSAAIYELSKTHSVAVIDCPLLYVYAVTGQNTWDAAHFERFFSWAECTFEGDEFDEFNGLLSDRLPMFDYACVLDVDRARQNLQSE